MCSRASRTAGLSPRSENPSISQGLHARGDPAACRRAASFGGWQLVEAAGVVAEDVLLVLFAQVLPLQNLVDLFSAIGDGYFVCEVGGEHEGLRPDPLDCVGECLLVALAADEHPAIGEVVGDGSPHLQAAVLDFTLQP